MPIVSVEELKVYTRNEIPTEDNIEYQLAADIADAEIFAYCQRNIALAGSATARTFVPTGGRYLRIPDATTVTSVVENGTTLTVTTNYQLEPVNRVQLTGETFPYEQILRQGASWYTYQDTGTVVVTATWGWPAIPAKVRGAARILAKDFLLHRDVQFGLVAMTESGGVRAKEAGIVATLLNEYRRVEAYGFA